MQLSKTTKKAKRQLTISKIIQHRQDNPFDTLQEIGEAFGFSRQYIYKVLKKNNMPTLRVKKRKVNYCLECNEPILVGNSKIHKGKCRFLYYNIKIECGFCKIPFYKKRYRDSIYCSMSCFKKANSEKALSK